MPTGLRGSEEDAWLAGINHTTGRHSRRKILEDEGVRIKTAPEK